MRLVGIYGLCLFLLACLTVRGVAWAQDAGDDAGTYGETPVDGGSSVPLACNGALCDTTNGSGCSSGGGPIYYLGMVVIAVSLLARVFARRRPSIRPPRTEPRR
jgi:hypothetical protein